MFDENSFSKESFDERSWFFGVVEAVAARLSRGKAVLVEYKQAHVVQKLAEALVWMRRP